MFNKAERARRVAAQDYHQRRYAVTFSVAEEPEVRLDEAQLDRLNSQARFHRKQSELWAKSVKSFDEAALRTAKLVGRKS